MGVLRSSKTRAALVCGLALFGLYIPSSIDGVISYPLSVVALVGTTMGIAILLVTSRYPSSRFGVQASCVIAGVLTAATLLSPFVDVSPGVVVLYGMLCLLLLVDLRDLREPEIEATAVRYFAGINVVSLVVGTLLVANVEVIDRAIVAWYSAFRPELTTEMVVLANKPVLTFGTHSMAAFVFYLFFSMCLAAYQAGRGPGWLLAVVGHLFLLTQFHSTTATIFLILAVSQLIWIPLRRASQPIRNAVIGVTAIAAVAIGIWLAGHPSASDELGARVFGDDSHGFISRYGANGLLAANLAYLAGHPFAPIGVTFSPSLYLGDSGVVVNALRGSLPLVLAVYAGILAFAIGNVRSRLAGLWLGCVIVLFEVGFTPLQYFRFLALLPLIVVFLNAIRTGDGREAAGLQPWSAVGATLWRRRWFLGAAVLAGAALGGSSTRVNTCCYSTEAVLRVGPPVLREVSRRWYASQVEAMAKSPEVMEAVLRSHPQLEDELGMPVESFRTGLVVEQRDDGRFVSIKMSLPRADTIEAVANGLADEVVAAAHERYWPLALPPERTLKLELVARPTAQGHPLRSIPVATLLGAQAGVLLAAAWLLLIPRRASAARPAP